MKILFDHSSPFLLAHGGFQIQIEQTKRALEGGGIKVEFLRWWDAGQKGDIIHFFGRPTGAYVDFAHGKGFRVVVAELLTGLGSRASSSLSLQKSTIAFVRRTLPAAFWAKMGWDAYEKADRILALTQWEAHLMQRIFRAPRERIEVVPNGVADEFLSFQDPKPMGGKFLICTATITKRKRVLELAEAAVAAQTPVWIIGEPYSDLDEYAQRFLKFARQFPEIVRYEGAVSDRRALASIYRHARGFVLLSTMESLSLSALEAAACGCPLLLSDLPWARSYFGDDATFCPIADCPRTATSLRHFYQVATEPRVAAKPLSWARVAEQLGKIYESTLRQR